MNARDTARHVHRTAVRRVNVVRKELAASLGGLDGLSAQQRILLDVVARDAVLLAVLDDQLIGLGVGIVNRRSRSVTRLLLERETVAGALTRRLLALGLDGRAGDPLATLRATLGHAASPSAPEQADEADDGEENISDAELAMLEGREHGDNNS